MIPITADQLARWRSEIDFGVEFRDKEFGTYRQPTAGAAPSTTLAGRNLDAYEQGAREDLSQGPPLNLVFPILKVILPTLLYQVPRATAIPVDRQPEAGEDAFYVSELVNRDLRDVDFRFKETTQQATFDDLLLGFGVVKVGYATEFGQDILPTEAEQKQRFRDKLKEQVKAVVQQVLGQPQAPKPPEPEPVQSDSTILQERPYVQWVDPFDFVVDPHARDLTDARWVAQRIRRTLADIKRDRRYSKEKSKLVADPVQEDSRLQESFVEEFQTVDLWEVHYKDVESPTGIRVLTFAATQSQTTVLLHEDNVLDLNGWQYEWQTLHKHGHRLYPISSFSVIRPLLERLNSSLDNILEQVDKFQSKLAYNERVSAEGKLSLESPNLGALVKINGEGDVRTAIAAISLEQVKQDLMGFVNQVVDLILVLVGVTRAQFTGLSTAQTATEAQIGQGGQNLRRTDEANVIGAWLNRVVSKLWRAKAQFQDLTSIQLVQETAMPDAMTGMTRTSWYPPIDQTRAERLKASRYQFHIEVSSIQKPNLEIIRAQFEQFVRALMEPQVTQGLALEGKRLSASELIRLWLRFFAEYGLTELSKVVVPVTDPMLQQALQTYGQKPSPANGNGQSRLTGAIPTYADQVSAAAGEKGMGASPV